MAEWLSGDVVADCIKIHYYRTGGDKPQIVLCHGATDDGLCWTPTARALEADYDVIMVDARGHGLSDAPEGGYDSKMMALDLAGFIQQLQLKKPILMGHSMGASTVFQATASYPGLVRAAILEDPPFRETSSEEEDKWRKNMAGKMRQAMLGYKSTSREALIAMVHKQNPTWPEDELGPWADSKLRLSTAFLDSQQKRVHEDPPWETLAKITCPVLLVTGDPDEGAIVTPEFAARAAAILPTLQVANIPGAGHNIRREGFAAYLKAVKGFLQSL